MRYLAIDHGKKRIGLAVCDADEVIASPLEVVEGHGGLIERIVNVVDEYQTEAVVLGLPLNMDGSEGAQAKLVRQFAGGLEKKLGIPILFHDERLSSFEAKEKLADAELTTKKKRRRLDAVAAAEILRSFLDEKHGQGA